MTSGPILHIPLSFKEAIADVLKVKPEPKPPKKKPKALRSTEPSKSAK